MRNDNRGFLPLIAVIVVVIVIGAAVWLLIGALSNPYGAMNQAPAGENCKVYARGAATFAVSAFFGAIHGEFRSVTVDKISDLNKAGPGFDLGSIVGKKGNAFVEVSVRGPGGMEVVAWKTPKVFMDFDLGQQASGESKPGSGETGYACFWESGISTWTFNLVFEDQGGAHDVLAVRQVQLEV